MEGITIKDIVAVTDGVLLCGDENKEIKEFSIDSRQGTLDSIFVPIIGERVDAHRFIEGALAINGATFTMEHDEPLAGCEDKPWIRVKDTVKAMQQVGTYYRRQLDLPVVAVTGSVGKTTTREMIACALSAGKNVFQTLGNQNSQVGVPLTLSHMTKDHEAAVLEIGMSERGQIAILTDMIRPNIAVVTLIGVSHIAQLGSQENICIEKMDITLGLPEDGLVFLNGDDPFLAPYKGKLDKRVFLYGMAPDCDYRAEDIGTENGKTSFVFVYEDGRLPVTLSTMGDHNVRNALAALGVCHQMGVDLVAAARKLSEFKGQRQNVIRTDRCILIDDTYNASPDSMKAAIKVLATIDAPEVAKDQGQAGRRIAGLSDMLELGENEKDYHYQVGAFIAGQPVDLLAAYGELSKEIIRGVKENAGDRDITCVWFETREELSDYLLAQVKPEDVLLLKGSNGMKLKEISERIQNL